MVLSEMDNFLLVYLQWFLAWFHSNVVFLPLHIQEMHCFSLFGIFWSYLAYFDVQLGIFGYSGPGNLVVNY